MALLERLRAHVEMEAERHRIQISYETAPSGTAEMSIRGGTVEEAKIAIRPIRSRSSYFVALHEIGHVNSWAAVEEHVLYGEASAWSWALWNSEVAPSSRAWEMIWRSWFSYVVDAAGEPSLSPELKRHCDSGGAALVPAHSRDWYSKTWRWVSTAAKGRVDPELAGFARVWDTETAPSE